MSFIIAKLTGGLGLGLAIVKNLVDRHGGTIAANSDGRDRGATFTIELPTVERSDEPAAIVQPQPSRSRSEIRVLVVDDNTDIAELLAGVGASVRLQVCSMAHMADRMSALVLLRRAFAIAALSLWIGGVTFYGLVVVPLGGKVLGNAAAQGFITQAVTLRLNLIGLIAIAALAWNASSTRGRRGPLWVTWSAMLITQVALLLLYPLLEAFLDTATRSIVDHEAFYARHRVYLLVTAGQWLAALVHMVLAIGGWRAEDRAA